MRQGESSLDRRELAPIFTSRHVYAPQPHSDRSVPVLSVEPNAVVEVKVDGGATVRIGNAERLSIIAGPCALESRQHALEMAHALAEIVERLDVGLIFKTELDKANRTSASAERGVGLGQALPIFAEV